MKEIFSLYQELCGLLGENNLREVFFSKIHHIVQETIDQIPDGARIAIRPAGYDTMRMLELYDFSEKNVIGIMDQKYRGDDYCGYPCYTVDALPAESYDCVIISTYYHRYEIQEELETLHIPYIDIYSEMEKRGVQLHYPYHIYESYPQMIVNYFYLRYLRAEAGPQRESALNELLQIAVEYKDFTLISNIYQDCGEEEGAFPLLKTVWRKSKHLLNCVQSKLHERKQKDIILFWTDAVPYKWLHHLPETMRLSQQGTFFQRAYANIPHTNPVLRAMFRGVLPIDDFPQNQEEIGSRNSSILRFMENEGYKVRLIGGSKLVLDEEHLLETHFYESCNIKWWNGIVDLLQSDEPCFYLFHFMESHGPRYVPDLKEFELKEFVNWFAATETQREIQIKAAYGYLDQCLLLYHKLLGDKTQIFLSDHGMPSRLMPTGRFEDQPIHPYCFVVGEGIPKTTVARFFPYINFEKLVRWIVDSTHFSLGDACTDEVIIQDTDFYSSARIDNFIQSDCEKFGIAFRGILNYDHKYVINSLGEEFFYQMQLDGSEKSAPLEDPTLRAELQAKAGTKFLDIYQYDKFSYTRKLYESINRKRHGENAT